MSAPRDSLPRSLPDLPRAFDAAWAAVAWFAILVALLSTAAFLLLRLGLETPARPVVAALTLLAAALFGPLALPARGPLAGGEGRALAFPLTALAILASPLLAPLTGPTLTMLHALLAAAGVARALPHARRARTRDVVTLCGTAFLVAAYLFIVVANTGYAGAYTPEQSLLGLLNHDTRFHVAATYMAQNFGIPSLGVDGLVPLRYHVGSHVWFAAFGRLTGAEPAWTFAVCVPLLGVPALLAALTLCGLALDAGRRGARACIGSALGLMLVSDTIGWNSYYISESYTFALIATLLGLPLLMRLARTDGSVRAARAGFVLAIAMIPLVMALKVSVGVLWAVAAGWIALRRFGLGWATVAVGVACLLLLLAGARLFAPGTDDYVHTLGGRFALFYIVRAFPEVRTLSSFVLPLCLVMYAVMHARTGWRYVLAARTDLPLEVACVVTLAGAIPPFVGIPQDSGAWYFLNVGQWYAMAVLASRLSAQDLAVWRAGLRQSALAGPLLLIGLFVFVSPVVESIKPNFFKSAGDLLRAADRQSGHALLNDRLATRYFRDSIATERALFGRDFRNALADSTGARLVAAVQAALGTDLRAAAVFVPPANEEFWEFQTACRDKHNVQAALSGVPSLLGAPPAKYACLRDSYQVDFGPGIESRALDDAALCERARRRALRRVLILESLRDQRANRMLDCGA